MPTVADIPDVRRWREIECLSTARIAGLCGCSRQRMDRFCARYGIPHSRILKVRECQWIGNVCYFRRRDGYYKTDTSPPRYMHRDVWIAANGPIPAGHQIHHINGAHGDNRLENLECIANADHQKRHGYFAHHR